MRLFFFKLNALQIFVLTFAVIILIGAALLSLPFAVQDEKEPLTFIDALFTSTSAMCVTGLIVVDTGSRFNLFGQWVILLLIQVGGLGIMTFSTFILLVIGKKIGISGSFFIKEGFTDSDSLRIGRLLVLIIIFTFVCEGAGTLFLFFSFYNVDGAGNPFWSALFHSVSAFCNAGFSLYADSFSSYSSVLSINLVIPGLIILGGIGFPVVYELARYTRGRFRKKPIRLNIHTKIVLIVTAALLLSGTALYYVSEPQCGPEAGGMLSAFFQSATARTAGFNTIDFSEASDASLLLTQILMFIGGSSGSTAGGIKTTTFMVILILVWTHISGKKNAEFSGRTISSDNTVKALALLVLFLIITLLASFGLLILHSNVPVPRLFASSLFEVISAIGTVGLSTGMTPYLNTGGKLIIIIVMFLGRLGPLAIARLFIKEKPKSNYAFPEGNLMIG